jgi:hypothetical protein
MKDKKEIILNRLNKIRQKIYSSEKINQSYEDEYVKIIVEEKNGNKI